MPGRRLVLSLRAGAVRRRLRRAMLLLAFVPLVGLAACHQEFGTAPHGGPAVGNGQPVATDIRTAIHPGFDRVVFDFAGAVPEYFVEYVAPNQLRGSDGNVVPVSGSHFLQVRFSGTEALAPAPFVRTPNFDEVRQVKRVDNFEGVLVYGVGVDERSPFRVFALTGPSRVVLDLDR